MKPRAHLPPTGAATYYLLHLRPGETLPATLHIPVTYHSYYIHSTSLSPQRRMRTVPSNLMVLIKVVSVAGLQVAPSEAPVPTSTEFIRLAGISSPLTLMACALDAPVPLYQ